MMLGDIDPNADCATIRQLASFGMQPPQVTYDQVPGVPLPVPNNASVLGFNRWMRCLAEVPAPVATPVQAAPSAPPVVAVFPTAAPPVTPVAGSPEVITYGLLDRQLPAILAQVAPEYVATANDATITMGCAACSDPKSALSSKLGQSPLGPGVTLDGIISRYASQINSACSVFQTEAQKRGMTGSCGATGGGFSLSGVSPVILIGGALLAVYLLMGRNR